MNDACSLCHRIEDWKTKGSPFLIHEFEHSVFFVGDHQYFRGYSLLLLKRHVRELHELTPAEQEGLFKELMAAGSAVAKTFKPWKMNYSCYGNVVEHIHWHIFPRYEDDPDHRKVPWTHMDDFMDAKTSPDQATHVASLIRANLAV